MRNYAWANEYKIGVVVMIDGIFTYLDAGPEYDAAVAAGPAPYSGPSDALDPTAPPFDLDGWRAAAKCSRLQGRLTLGSDVCAALDAMAADPATPWAMRETINSAMEWRRTSQTIDELGYLLGYTDAQMDALFTAAMQITA